MNGGVNGNNGTFGVPSGVSHTNALPCGGTITGMAGLPVQYLTTPVKIADVHAHICIETDGGLGSGPTGVCRTDPINPTAAEVAGTAQVFYDDLANYLSAVQSFQSVTQTLMMGEVNSVQANPCLYPQETAYDHVAGFKSSSIYTNTTFPNSSYVIFRPWENLEDPTTPSCYAMPNIISTPYKKGN